MIKLSNISKKYDGSEVVRDINLTIKPGEIVGLLGPNGAGKTTTIRMITGILPPSSGQITIDGKNFENHESELKQKIGYLPENNPLYDEMTVEEHLKFWGKLKGLSDSELDDAITFAVDNTSIAPAYYRFIGELSKGYRQRVGLAQAILSQPEILILDEPTEGLDPNQRREIQSLLSDLKKYRTVILSSHVLSEVSRLANRIIIIHKGRVVSDDSPQNLVKTKEKIQIINLEVTGKKILQGLKSLKGVQLVAKEGTNIYRLETTNNSDIRPEIFNAAVNNKWILLGMQRQERQLEDVFSELTEE